MDMQGITTVADTSFVVALLNGKDSAHPTAIRTYAEQGTILLPQTVLAEVAYLLSRDAGVLVLIKFLKSLTASRFQLESLLDEDIEGIAEILEQYQDSRIDFVDASVMVIAERYNLNLALTLDRRDFGIYRPSSGLMFTLKP
ncbi:MAG: PIN domain-containing protein [Cyanothece sp. SIO2G6]|nr:PIN domain-containing protein [Cyanothece sp. SIO2G6]